MHSVVHKYVFSPPASDGWKKEATFGKISMVFCQKSTRFFHQPSLHVTRAAAPSGASSAISATCLGVSFEEETATFLLTFIEIYLALQHIKLTFVEIYVALQSALLTFVEV